MGDRANIKIKESTGNSLWIYSHWNGYQMPQLLQTALKAAEPRWTDESYFQRILVDQITKAGRDQEVSWGLSTYPCDNEYNILEVDAEQQKIRLFDKQGFFDERDDWDKNKVQLKEWTFREFLAIKADWPNINKPAQPARTEAKAPTAFNESDCGGVYDGHQVYSDTELGGAPGF